MINQVHINPASNYKKKGEDGHHQKILKKKGLHRKIESVIQTPMSIIEAHNKLVKSQEMNLKLGKSTLEAWKES